MKRKYLDDLGVKDRWDLGFDETDRRMPIWQEQQQIYGFDSRECWGLDSTFYQWLYERLMMYKEKAQKVVDLTYHKFSYEGNGYTQIELIDAMLERLRLYFSDSYNEYDEKQWNYVHEIERIWAVVLPAMWY